MNSEPCDFWKRVDEELIYRGIDRKVFAKDIEISLNTISSGISRRSKPDVEIALKSSQYLNIPLEYLLYGKMPANPQDFSSENLSPEPAFYSINHNREIFSVSRKLQLIPADTRAPIIQMINEISKNYTKSQSEDSSESYKQTNPR